MTRQPPLPAIEASPARAAVPAAPTWDEPSPSPRLEARGKFLFAGDTKVFVRGVTYGPFRAGPGGDPYEPATVERDFARIAAAGFNAARLYTPPPGWLLDAAERHGLVVLAGVAWEQHVAFLDERSMRRSIVRRVAGGVRELAGHPALLAWTVGNEIPAPIVRWYGPARVARFLAELAQAVRSEDPRTMVTYVNYPSTEYLELDFLDLVCFNVFLEERGSYEAYLDRLQNLAGDRPLLLTEVGLDSRRHGEGRQAEVLDWQVRGALASGAAGAFVFSWTDEWHRGGLDIEDWDFGLTRRDRSPKPALTAVRDAFDDAPRRPLPDDPSFTVAICTYNGSRTLPEACRAVQRLDYPRYEALLIDDGSTDDSAEIARAHGFRVISTENRGLSAARNTAMEEATGDVVAYVDDDAAPDPDWLTFLADTYARTGAVAAGGPNLAVPGDGLVADAIAAAPGNPTHVLVSDREAEHIPGCNSSFRRDALRAIGGFDPRFRIAADDVDVCWRLQDRGWHIAYSPAAVVWHHRRNSIRGFLRQQRSYGHAEALLERKWPERYSAGGHVTWRGRLYGEGAPRRATGPLHWRIYYGTWGSAPFQSLYEPARGEMNTVLLMPEIYLAIGVLAVLAALGALWTPLVALVPVVVVLAGVLALRAVAAAAVARFPTPDLSAPQVLARRAIATCLHLFQPLARLEGRMRHGLTPWRRRGAGSRKLPVPYETQHWSETWTDPLAWVRCFEGNLVERGAVVRRGLDFDDWDLDVRGGTLAGVQLTVLVEEHGQGRQLARVKMRAVWSRLALLLVALAASLAAAALVDGRAVAAAAIALVGCALGLRIVDEAASAMAAVRAAVARPPGSPPPER